MSIFGGFSGKKRWFRSGDRIPEPESVGGLPERPFDVIEIWRERRNYLKDFSGNTLTKCTALPAHLPGKIGR